jgi:hypothetical protein
MSRGAKIVVRGHAWDTEARTCKCGWVPEEKGLTLNETRSRHRDHRIEMRDRRATA